MRLNRTVGDEIFRILRKRIVTLELKFGEKIDPQKISQELGVSQTPIREALNRLSHRKLAISIPRVGYYVVRPSEGDVREICYLRKLLEGDALGSVVEKLDRKRLREFRQKVRDIQTRKDTGEEFFKLDERFHRWIVSSSPIKRLKDFFSQIYDLVVIFQRITGSATIGKTSKDHIAIIDFLLQKDVEGAREVLNNHIDDTQSRVMRVLKSEKKLTKKEEASYSTVNMREAYSTYSRRI